MIEGIQPSQIEPLEIPLSIVDNPLEKTEESLQISAKEQLLKGEDGVPSLRNVLFSNDSEDLHAKTAAVASLLKEKTFFFNRAQTETILDEFTLKEIPESLFPYLFYLSSEEENNVANIPDEKEENANITKEPPKIVGLVSLLPIDYIKNDNALAGSKKVEEAIVFQVLEGLNTSLTTVKGYAQSLQRAVSKNRQITQEREDEFLTAQTSFKSQYALARSLGIPTLITNPSSLQSWENIQHIAEEYLSSEVSPIPAKKLPDGGLTQVDII